MLLATIAMTVKLLAASAAELQAPEPEPTPVVEYIDCGMCGAHVSEWHYVRDDFGEYLVEVCDDCYELFK